ncbi:MAG: hypothetical protein HQL08_08180 [Nitrospirae bacterium]|nr:hypothetical protein [Nitrospirota bacterium]
MEMTHFLVPYFSLALTAAYSLLQNLEALGILRIWHGPYIELRPTVNVIAGIYFILILMILVFNIITAFALSNRLALSLVLIWAIPGILSLLGYEIKPYGPQVYTLGQGNLGNGTGTFTNIVLVFIFGWSLFTLLMHIFKAGFRFRNIYDHIWYVLGLSAAIFLVVDMSISSTAKKLSDAEGYIEGAETILIRQTRTAESFCAGEHSYIPPAEFCAWARAFKHQLLWSQNDKPFTRSDENRLAMEEVLSFGDGGNVGSDIVLKQIRFYNATICANAKLKHYCEFVPLVLNNHPKLADPDTNVMQKYALAVESLVPTITLYWGQSVKENNNIEEGSKAPHKRWFYFLALGILAGGKVAIASRNVFGGREEPVYRNGICWGIGFVWKIIISIGRRFRRLTLELFASKD